MMDIGELLAFSVKNGASDLHLSAGLPPMIRVDGDVRRINVPPLEHKEVHALVYDIMNDKQRKDYEEFLECDFSFEIPGLARFRVNAFNHNRGAGAVFRTIPSDIYSPTVISSTRSPAPTVSATSSTVATSCCRRMRSTRFHPWGLSYAGGVTSANGSPRSALLLASVRARGSASLRRSDSPRVTEGILSSFSSALLFLWAVDRSRT